MGPADKQLLEQARHPSDISTVVAIDRGAMSQSYELELQTVGQPTAPPILAGLVAQTDGPSANIEIRMDETTGKRYSVDLVTNESKWVDEGDYLDQLMADEALDSLENDLLYEASWHELNCGNCSSEDASRETVSNNSSRKPDVVVKVTDKNVTIVKREELLPCSLPFNLCRCPSVTTTKMDTSAIQAVITSEKQVTCCSYFQTYTVWLCCGLCGCHYHMHRKRFRQTAGHKLFLLVWFLTCGCGGLLWCIDGFRIFRWLQAHTITIYGKYVSGKTAWIVGIGMRFDCLLMFDVLFH